MAVGWEEGVRGEEKGSTLRNQCGNSIWTVAEKELYEGRGRLGTRSGE